MASINKVLLLGNLGRDPELRSTPKGNSVLNFPMATSRRWKDRETEEVHDETDWHRIVVWGRQAEVLSEYLKKGSQIHVEGRLQTRSWSDNDGAKRYTTEIVASRIQMLGRPEDRRAPESIDEPEVPAASTEPTGDDDIPF
ncbi:MAG: single-stranded DNA-binding protein [Deltaproteobacteria bacterium]|nr:single-stranded DNA-binding protein [Deltaproteobacteria bacterium]